jgi:hypothetical protein
MGENRDAKVPTVNRAQKGDAHGDSPNSTKFRRISPPPQHFSQFPPRRVSEHPSLKPAFNVSEEDDQVYKQLQQPFGKLSQTEKRYVRIIGPSHREILIIS